jgi:FkbM family methyltransferase
MSHRVKQLFKRLLSRFGLYLSRGYTLYLFGNKKIVRRQLYGREVLLPRSHAIVYNLAHFPYYNSNLQRIVRQYQSLRPEDFSILDVGANIGDTLLMLRQVSDRKIHCFEGDPFYYRLLEKNSAGIDRCYLHQVMLSDKPGATKVKSNRNLGTSTFTSDSGSGTMTAFTTIDEFFSGHSSVEPFGIIKTDTDGYDLKILRGAAETIRRSHPVLFLEYDRSLFEKNGDDGLQFLGFLESLGYDGLLVYDNFGKLLCISSLRDRLTVRALHAYIRERQTTIPFYDLAVFPAGDQTVFESIAATELAFFEQ